MVSFSVKQTFNILERLILVKWTKIVMKLLSQPSDSQDSSTQLLHTLGAFQVRRLSKPLPPMRLAGLNPHRREASRGQGLKALRP